MSRVVELDSGLLELLPPWYREVLDYQQICKTEQAQLEALAAAIRVVSDNFFFQTMGEGAVSRWEKLLGILPAPALETLEFRRLRLLSRLSTKPPFTLGFLHQKLDGLIGPGKWAVRVDYAHHTLAIESAAQNQSYAAEVAFTIGRVKPAHIVYVNTPLVSEQMLASEQVQLFSRDYHYRLGSWALGQLPFTQSEEKGVVKMYRTPSVQDRLLFGMAGFVLDKVAAARINGSETITQLEKAMAGNTLTISYVVPQQLAAEITLVELLDEQEGVLTSSQVYVPVAGSVVLKHTIPIREGGTENG